MQEPAALARLIYASRSTTQPDSRAGDVAAILQAAHRHNPQHGITGMLVAANGHFLQLLEGPPAQVHALYQHICTDARHDNVALLCDTAVSHRSVPDWSMCLVERSEPETATAARVALLQSRLADDPEATTADFFRLLFAPSVSAASGPRTAAVRRMAFASPGGLWSAGVLQRAAVDAMLRTGRTHITDAADPAHRDLLEYIDLEVPHVGPVRAISVMRDPSSCSPVAHLLEGISLLVFMLSPSEVALFEANLHQWADHPLVQAARPRVLVLSSSADEGLQRIVDTLCERSGLVATLARIKLGDTLAVWQMAVNALLETRITGRHAERALPASASAPAPEDGWRRAILDSGCLDELLEMDGALHAAVLRTAPPAVLAAMPAHAGVQQAMQGCAEVLQLQQSLVNALCSADSIDDIAVTTAQQFQIFRPLPGHAELFLALTLERSAVALGAARLKVQDVASAMQLLRP